MSGTASPAAAGQSTGSGALAIELRNISKRFGPVKANENINLQVARGTIHGIVGENGAGKSTLMSILYGFYHADEGEVLIGGKQVDIHNSRDAIEAGIGMVHQHFMLVDTFTVLENVMLGAVDDWRLQRSAVKARQELRKLSDEYQLSVNPDAVVGDLPVGEQQRTEILKALYRHAEILILDEPTGVLTPQEADQLFRVLQALKARGVTIILITHKLREIIDVTDNVSVLRMGEMVAHRRTADTSIEELAELMVGRKLQSSTVERVTDSDAEPGIDVRGLSLTGNHGTPALDNVHFQVRRGEIVGIAGVAGNGQSELLEVLAGMTPVEQGEFSINGQRVTAADPMDPAMMRGARINHVPEDRLKLGLVKEFNAAETAILGYQEDPEFSAGALFRLDVIRQNCQRLMQAYDVRPPNPSLRSGSFSGGNQQKLIVAREFDRAPDVLLIGQPTRGVDIGAIELIHKAIVSMRDSGSAVLLVSVELDEIMALSDRILVMFEGRIVGELAAAEADKTLLGLMMANAHQRTGGTENSA